MDAGSPFRSDQAFQRRKPSRQNLDRFIPNRSAMDFDFARSMLTGGKVGKEISKPCFESQAAYRENLAEILGLSGRRILAFKDKPQPSKYPTTFEDPVFPVYRYKPAKPRRYIHKDPEKILDAPGVVDYSCLNLLDWGSSNILAIALENTVHLWDALHGSASELLTVGEEAGPVTSIRWAPDGRHLAVGLSNSNVQIWDSSAIRQVSTLEDGHTAEVGSLDWNNHLLTSGGMDGLIINHDMRTRPEAVGIYKGHSKEVCGLRWSESGQQLASGGNDNKVYIWSSSMSSSQSPTRWIHRLADHKGSVGALSWCPSQRHVLATGGDDEDRSIKFWNTSTGICLNSVNTGSEVCCLLWNRHQRELLSSHGSNMNGLILWTYPSMNKIVELFHHTSRVLSMAQSPRGDMVASLAADEKLAFWEVFEAPKIAKVTRSSKHEPLSKVAEIR